ncbi:PcfJ domain-containing protein [Mesorhizobium yinganensis]|uniref:PcfJ domain-containing protein n=1 Tax=Mesorhizobium yinganensis TaxID=3157707 RepID=UPI0032B83085
MARSTIRRRQEAERQRIEAYEATLRRVSAVARPAPNFETALREAKRGFESEIIRDTWVWRPQLKTRDPARLRLAAARHLFARYVVPAHLEAVWLDCDGLRDDEIRLRKRWYVAVAGGGSLYKAGAGEWLSRREVHWFLNSPGDLSFDEALWQAIARTYTDDPGIALRVARSKVGRRPRSEFGFWREVARFFCANPVSIEEIDDLSDYLADAYRRNRAYSLKGRTLVSMRRLMEQWHRDIAAIERIEATRRRAAGRIARAGGPASQGEVWPGSQLADWEWQPSEKEAACRNERFVVRQLKHAEDLVAESRAMHHCVSSYASKCIAGNASIWVLRRCALGKVERLLTIELDPRNRAVQVRGFRNRLARPDELKILTRWAKSRGVLLP